MSHSSLSFGSVYYGVTRNFQMHSSNKGVRFRFTCRSWSISWNKSSDCYISLEKSFNNLRNLNYFHEGNVICSRQAALIPWKELMILVELNRYGFHRNALLQLFPRSAKKWNFCTFSLRINLIPFFSKIGKRAISVI